MRSRRLGLQIMRMMILTAIIMLQLLSLMLMLFWNNDRLCYQLEIFVKLSTLDELTCEVLLILGDITILRVLVRGRGKLRLFYDV